MSDTRHPVVRYAATATRWLRRHPWLLVVVACTLIGASLIFWDLGESPPGPTVDELSIGINAHHIGTQGRDEHGERFPTYFKAFHWGKVGEYKNPVYIYLLAPFEVAFGPSDFVLRLPAALLAFLLALSLGLSVLELHRQKRLPTTDVETRLLALAVALAALTTPWVFQFGRLALEGISFPAFLALALWLTLVCRRRGGPFIALGAGFAWGLALYTYSTARLLVPLFLIALFFTHLGWVRRHWLAAICLVAGAVIAAIPLWLFMQNHPDALTQKFLHQTLCHPQPQELDAFWKCLDRPATRELIKERYLAYLSFKFLFRSGDPNTLHCVPGHGVLHLYWLPLLGLGVAWLWRQRRMGLSWFIPLALLLSPIAASVMRESQNAIRAIAALPFWLLLGAVGAAEILHLARNADGRTRRVALVAVSLVILLETAGYLSDFHGEYRRLLYHRHHHVATAKAFRVAAANRRKGGHFYIPAHMARNPRTGHDRLRGHYSVFWRYYLRIPGPWNAPNAHRYGIYGGPALANAPPGSTAVVQAKRRGKTVSCRHPVGFRLVANIRTPGKKPKLKLCVFAK